MYRSQEAPQQYLHLISWLTLVAIVAMIGLAAFAWTQIPAGKEIPIHWNAAGEVDGYGSKSLAFSIVPIISLFLYPLFAFGHRFQEQDGDVDQSRGVFAVLWAAFLLFLTGCHVSLVLAALGFEVPVGRIMPIGLGLAFLVLGNYMGKLRRNRIFGVRTKSTLSDEEIWNKTNRLGGKLLMLAGAAIIVLALIRPLFAVFGIAASCAGLLVWSLVYPYRLAKQKRGGLPN